MKEKIPISEPVATFAAPIAELRRLAPVPAWMVSDKELQALMARADQWSPLVSALDFSVGTLMAEGKINSGGIAKALAVNGSRDWAFRNGMEEAVFSIDRLRWRIIELCGEGLCKVATAADASVIAVAATVPKGQSLLAQVRTVLSCGATATQIVDRYRQAVESGDAETISRVAEAIESDPTWRAFEVYFLRMTSEVKMPAGVTASPRIEKSGKRKPGPLSEADLEQELWRTLKHFKDPYELAKSKLTHIKEVEALAKQRYPDNAYAAE